nr:hypothetical protein [Tanacetum cinerariifolium]
MVVQSELVEGSTMPTDPHHTPIILQSSSSSSQLQKTHKPRKPTRKITQVPHPSEPIEHVTDEAVHKELRDHLTKTIQSNEIASLKKRVKKLEKKNMSGTHKIKRLYKVGLTTRVESSDEESLGEDASKQERIEAIDTDEDITLVNDQDDTYMFDVNDLGGEEVFVVEQGVVSTAATTIITKELTLAQALEALKTSKPKVRGTVIQEQELDKSTTTTKIPKQKSQDKGKGIMVEEPVKPKKKEQIRRKATR